MVFFTQLMLTNNSNVNSQKCFHLNMLDAEFF